MDNIDFSDFFKTREESIIFLTHLTNILEKIYTSNFDFNKTLIEELGVSKKDKFIALLVNNNVNINSQNDLSNFLNKIIEKISSLSTLNITLAFEPDERTFQKLSQWFLINTKKQFLFEIKVDKELIAGVEILANGRHIDLSVKERFDQIIKEAVIESIKKLANARTSNNANSANPQISTLKSN